MQSLQTVAMRESIVAETVVTRKQISIRTLLPAIAVMAFLAMVAIGERQVRLSPKWPPPSRHEVGAWEIETPRCIRLGYRSQSPCVGSDSLPVAEHLHFRRSSR